MKNAIFGLKKGQDFWTEIILFTRFRSLCDDRIFDPDSKDRALVSKDVTGGGPTVYFGETLLVRGGTERGAELQELLAFIKEKYPEKYLSLLQSETFRSKNFEILTRALFKNIKLRDHQCDLCGQAFYTERVLKKHVVK